MVTAEPFANGVTRAAELPSGCFEAIITSKANQLLMEPVTVGAHAIEFEIGAMHPERVA